MVDTARLGVDEAARVILHAAATRGIECLGRGQFDLVMHRTLAAGFAQVADRAVAESLKQIVDLHEDVWDQMLILARVPVSPEAIDIPIVDFPEVLTWETFARESPTFFVCVCEGLF